MHNEVKRAQEDTSNTDERSLWHSLYVYQEAEKLRSLAVVRENGVLMGSSKRRGGRGVTLAPKKLVTLVLKFHSQAGASR